LLLALNGSLFDMKVLQQHKSNLEVKITAWQESALNRHKLSKLIIFRVGSAEGEHKRINDIILLLSGSILRKTSHCTLVHIKKNPQLGSAII
jgi:hypothetical protein